MNFNLKEMYSYLLSHTFPGMLFITEIFLFLPDDVHKNISDTLLAMMNNHGSILLIIAGYLFSTLLGTMIDGVQHFIFDFFVDMEGSCKHYNRVRVKNKKDARKKFLALNGDEKQIKAYGHFIDDDLWYPYESYANIFVAMFFGLVLFLLRTFFGFWVGFAVIAFIVALALCFEANNTYRQALDESEVFFEVCELKKGMQCSKLES